MVLKGGWKYCGEKGGGFDKKEVEIEWGVVTLKDVIVKTVTF